MDELAMVKAELEMARTAAEAWRRVAHKLGEQNKELEEEVEVLAGVELGLLKALVEEERAHERTRQELDRATRAQATAIEYQREEAKRAWEIVKERDQTVAEIDRHLILACNERDKLREERNQLLATNAELGLALAEKEATPHTEFGDTPAARMRKVLSRRRSRRCCCC